MAAQFRRSVLTIQKRNEDHMFVFMPERTALRGNPLSAWVNSRFMTTSKRVKDRSKKKRLHDLEMATEKWKIFSKVTAIMEILQQEPEMIIPVRHLDKYRSKINLSKPHRISDFLRKSPEVFELYKDQRGLLWCGMTKEAEVLLAEEGRLIEEHGSKASEYVTRCLMMSVDKRLPVAKIAHFRRDFGLPIDFRTKWVHMYPELFKVVKSRDEVEYLELVSWNPSWAVTELEKKVLGLTETSDHKPALLSLAFPLKFPSSYKAISRYKAKIDHFQKISYLSPYADATGLSAGSLEFDKRAVAIMHELLSFTLEKRLVTDHLTHFRQEFVMPQKLMRLLLKHVGIFYVSERGKRFSVFLTEAYDGRELKEKSPLVLWREKLLNLVGYRKKKERPMLSDISDMEDSSLILNDSESEDMDVQFEHGEAMGGLDHILSSNNDQMEIREDGSRYSGSDAF